jgi:hypothetical protein
MDYTTYPQFASLFTSGFSVNWPHKLSDILEEGLDGLVVTESFIGHIRDLGNWTVSEKLVESFPFLNGAVNVKGSTG